ncbi:MAG: patatin-like phospholipase family protein, partial [Synechococcaceae cyanobacterium]|nr:patatin-like phospholipase family protein [Synechococcaceae cyanobacterium]
MASARVSSRQPLMGDRGYIGLSFSGGGYRATAFSLGTMALLQDLGLLSKARVMSSVSGGSLALAAYLCAKAGARPRQESDFHFYEKVWDPLMLELSRESLADAFVR